MKTQLNFSFIASIGLVFGILGGSAAIYAQSPSAAERLGYPREAKLLIIGADDLASAHSIDLASFRALEAHNVSSVNVMVPCPWFPEVVDYARQHPEADIGLHMTLNSDYKTFRWGPQAARNQVPSLLDPDGYLWWRSSLTLEHGQPAEVEREIRAQIEQAIRMGLHPTYLSEHNGVPKLRKDFFTVELSVAHEYHLPYRASRPYLEKMGLLSMVSPQDIIQDRSLTVPDSTPPVKWLEAYMRMLDQVVPGFNEMVVHLGYDDPELQAVIGDYPGWSAARLQRDFDVLGNPMFKEALRSKHIIVIGWRELDKLVP